MRRSLRSSLRIKQSKTKCVFRHGEAGPKEGREEFSPGPQRLRRKKEEKQSTKRSSCERCGEMFKPSEMDSHHKRHETEVEYRCGSCEKAFVCMLAYHRHGSRVHNKELVCEKCGKKFSKTDYFIRHVKFGHAEKSYACVLCSFATPESNQLRMHMEKRHLKKYTLFCDVCSKGFFDRSSLKEHENIHTGATPYQCEVCGMSFKIKCTLRAHKLKFHPHLFPHVCQICGKGLSTKEGLDSHLRLHAENRKFMCDVCGRNLNTPRSLLEHRRLHTGERPFECGLCMKSYPAQKHLIRHVKLVHTGERPEKNHECRHCNKKYASMSACLSHEKICSVAVGYLKRAEEAEFRDANEDCSSQRPKTGEKKKRRCEPPAKTPCGICGEKFTKFKMRAHLCEHDSKRPHPCDSCEKVFVSVKAWYRHGFKVHDKQLKCDDCNKSYRNTDNFMWHLRYVHREKVFKCSICTYSTTVRGKLKRHITGTHMKQCALHCDVCSKGFADRFHLEEHKHLHSGDAPNQCEVCGKIFRLRTTLRAHRVKFHPDVCPNVCLVCRKGFATESGLEAHHLTHVDSKKQYVCEFCGKCLTTGATLKEHKRIHTGELPFQCEVCGKAFRAKKHLTRHVRNHLQVLSEKKTHECHFCDRSFSSFRSCEIHARKCHY